MEGIRKHFWKTLALFLAMALWVAVTNNRELKRRNELLHRINIMQEEWCYGIEKVNGVCEKALLDLLIRLGLDNEMMPLVTTVYWERLTNKYSISIARKKLGAKETSDGLLNVGEAIGGME